MRGGVRIYNTQGILKEREGAFSVPDPKGRVFFKKRTLSGTGGRIGREGAGGA